MTPGSHDRDDLRTTGATSTGTDVPTEVVLSEEQLRVGTTTEQIGTVRARKHVETETVQTRVDRGTEHAEMDRVAVEDAATDSGQVETLPDGSLSIPVFEEQIVVTKKLVVRERVIVRKHTVYEEHVVTADLRSERLEVDVDGDVVVRDDDAPYPSTATQDRTATDLPGGGVR